MIPRFIELGNNRDKIIKNPKKDDAEKKLKDSIYNYFDYCFNDNTYDNKEITYSYYFDENKGCYVETCTGLELIFFIKNKRDTLSEFKSSLKFEDLKDICKLINDKNIPLLYQEFY